MRIIKAGILLCYKPKLNWPKFVSTEFLVVSRPTEYVRVINHYSAGIDFSRQNLTSTDVRFWRL